MNLHNLTPKGILRREGIDLRALLTSVAVFVLSLCAGCTRKIYVPVETQRVSIDTVSLLRHRVDTVYDCDSIVIITRGDTVCKESFRIRYRTRLRTDTVYRSRTDTIPVAYPVPAEPPASKSTPGQRLRSAAGQFIPVILVAVILAAVMRARERRREGGVLK